MQDTATEKRVDRLEEALLEMVYQSRKTEMNLDRLASEMRAFKDDVKVFKDQMLDFKDEMKGFKDEMLDFKNEMKVFKDEMLDFKDEMRVFKDEMKAFKDQMLDFKDEMRLFKDEMEAFKNEMRAITKEMNKKWGDLANKLGTLAEDIVAPGISVAIEGAFGLDVKEVSVRRKRKMGERSREYDVIAVAGNYLFLVDVKSTYRAQYLGEFDRAIEEFLDLFPEYEGLRIISVIASLNLSEDVVNLATKRGWLALQMYGDYLEFVNKDQISLEIP